MQYEDAVLLDKEMEFNIWRAPTDNDRKLKLDWLAARYDHCMTAAPTLRHRCGNRRRKRRGRLSRNGQMCIRDSRRAGRHGRMAHAAVAGRRTRRFVPRLRLRRLLPHRPPVRLERTV